MNAFYPIHSVVTFFMMATLLSCGNSGNGNTETNQAAKPEVQNSNTAATAPTGNKNGATVSFAVNGVEANTMPGSNNDKDEPIGLWNVTNNHISLTLMGDDPKFPHRGSLTLNIDGFKPEPATYTMSKSCYAGFSRYTTVNAGGETQYSASVPDGFGTPEKKAENAKRKCSITFDKVEKQPSEFGEKYLVSGSFSAILTLGLGFENEVSLIDIANGKFENVPVSLLGKK